MHFIFFQYGKAGSVEEEGAATASFLLGNMPWKGIQEDSRWKTILSGQIRSLRPAAHAGDSSDPLGEELAPSPASVCSSSLWSSVTRLRSKDEPLQLHTCVHGDLIVCKPFCLLWSTQQPCDYCRLRNEECGVLQKGKQSQTSTSQLGRKQARTHAQIKNKLKIVLTPLSPHPEHRCFLGFLPTVPTCLNLFKLWFGQDAPQWPFYSSEGRERPVVSPQARPREGLW